MEALVLVVVEVFVVLVGMASCLRLLDVPVLLMQGII